MMKPLAVALRTIAGAVPGVLSSMGGTPLSDEHRKVLADVEAECKSLSIQNDTTGGYLAPPEYVKEIIKGITEMSPVRSLVRVRSTGAKSIMLPSAPASLRRGAWASRRPAPKPPVSPGA